MEWLDILQQFIEICVIPAVGVVLSYLALRFVKKLEEDKKQTEADIAQQYLERLNELIIACIKSTNQTYVDVLKKEGKFDAVAHKIALSKTVETVMSLISSTAESYISTIVGDLKKYVTEKVEASIEEVKIEKNI